MKTRILRTAAVLFATLGLLLAMGTAASAQTPDGIVSIELEGCDIIVTYGSSNGGNFILEVWDDGILLGTDAFVVPPGGTGQGRYTITAAVQQGAAGLGIYVSQNTEGNWVDWVDPYTGADDILEFCRDQSTTSTSTPITRPPGTQPTTSTTQVTTTTVVTTTVPRPTTTVPRPTTTMVTPTTAPGTTPTSAGSGGAVRPATPARPVAATASYTG